MQDLFMVTARPTARSQPWLTVASGEPPDEVDEMEFPVDHLPGVRRFAAAHARRSGLPEESVGDLVIAVNEVATNGVRHGSPVAELRMWKSGGHLVAEVHDQGHWIPSVRAGSVPPTSDAEGGMGLWVTRQICSSVQITTGDNGTTVRLEMPLPSEGYPPVR